MRDINSLGGVGWLQVAEIGITLFIMPAVIALTMVTEHRGLLLSEATLPAVSTFPPITWFILVKAHSHGHIRLNFGQRMLAFLSLLVSFRCGDGRAVAVVSARQSMAEAMSPPGSLSERTAAQEPRTAAKSRE